MARKSSDLSNGVSKSEQIRQVAREIGSVVRPRDVIRTLEQRGVSVTSGQVSTVLASMGKKRRGRRGRRPAATVAVASTISLDSLLAAKRLADQLGGVQAAKTAVNALAKLS